MPLYRNIAGLDRQPKTGLENVFSTEYSEPSGGYQEPLPARLDPGLYYGPTGTGDNPNKNDAVSVPNPPVTVIEPAPVVPATPRPEPNTVAAPVAKHGGLLLALAAYTAIALSPKVKSHKVKKLVLMAGSLAIAAVLLPKNVK